MSDFAHIKSIHGTITIPTCDNCYLAYPEKGANNLLVSLTEVENEYLSKLAEKYGVTRVEALRRLITRSLPD